MRRIGAWALCVAAAGIGWAQAPEECAIEGRVVNALTGAPLKKTLVWVEPFSPSRGVNHEPTVTGPSTVTDAQGRFRLAEVEAGSYFLSARRTGYLNQGYGAEEPDVVGPPVKLAAGDRLGDVTLKLTPQALLYGKVTDEDGEAVPDTEVSLYRISYAGGRKQFEVESGTVSQADGSIIIGNVAPGRYYLGASIRGERETDSRDVYVPTYYPSTTEASAAGPIDVAAGAEVRGLEIRLRKARTFSIRGHGPANTSLHLVARGEAVAARLAIGTNTGSDGRYEFTGVLPGRYTIAAEQGMAFFAAAESPGMPARMAAPQTVLPAVVEVTDSDLDDVVLPVAESLNIKGTFVGGKPGTRAGISLVPQGGATEGGWTPSAQPDAAGAFAFEHILPGEYEVAVTGLADGFYVKTVRFAGRDITNQDLDLISGASGTLEITLSADGGEIAGTARGTDGKALPGALVQVWPAGGDNARSLKADENGSFRFRALPAADYRVIAWEALDDDLAEYPPFRARFEAQAAEVRVAEQGHENVDVTAVTRAASAAEAAKLR
jgi:protocatechuate 3,4-dioxygenase beta subunit